MGSLAEEIRRVTGGLPISTPPFVIATSSITYNGKDLFFADFDAGQISHVGPDTGTGHQMNIIIPSLSSIAGSMPIPATPMPGTFTANDFRDFALIQVDAMDQDLDTLNNVRSVVGVQLKALGMIINDLNRESISLSGSKSQISDANMAEAITELKQNLTLQETFTTAMVQFEDMEKSRLTLINAMSLTTDQKLKLGIV